VAITFVSPSSETNADEVISKIARFNNGSRAIKIQADMHDVAAPQKIVAETTAAFGSSIDILVNNAAVAKAVPLEEITLDHFTDHVDVNFRSVVFTTQAVLPHLRSPGRIINLGSTTSRTGQPASSVYSATKAAVEALARSWAADLGAAGHTVNNVAPGLTSTDMNAHGKALPEQAVEILKATTPLEHRLGTPEDIALVVAMLAEPASRWITGQTIQASGGNYMS
ncbi:Short-chain dehydrogenase/reductase SDR, partial [Macrophomina phaseolina MS6]